MSVRCGGGNCVHAWVLFPSSSHFSQQTTPPPQKQLLVILSSRIALSSLPRCRDPTYFIKLAPQGLRWKLVLVFEQSHTAASLGRTLNKSESSRIEARTEQGNGSRTGKWPRRWTLAWLEHAQLHFSGKLECPAYDCPNTILTWRQDE